MYPASIRPCLATMARSTTSTGVAHGEANKKDGGYPNQNQANHQYLLDAFTHSSHLRVPDLRCPQSS